MTVTAEQLARYRDAFATLRVVGPEWLLPPVELFANKERSALIKPPYKSGKRAVEMLTAFGRTQALTTWAKEKRRSARCIRDRIKGGATPEEALSAPVVKGANQYGRLQSKGQQLREIAKSMMR